MNDVMFYVVMGALGVAWVLSMYLIYIKAKREESLNERVDNLEKAYSNVIRLISLIAADKINDQIPPEPEMPPNETVNEYDVEK